MPVYQYMNMESGHVVDRLFKYSDKPQTIEVEGKEYQWIPSAPMFSYSDPFVVSKINGDLKSRLNEIKKNFNPNMRTSV